MHKRLNGHLTASPLQTVVTSTKKGPQSISFAERYSSGNYVSPATSGIL